MALLKILPPAKAQTTFEQTLNANDISLARNKIEILQINVGKYCNLACLHCHVEAGPKRTEKMTMETAKKIIDLLAQDDDIHTVDLTGGAPELHDVFPYLVEESAKLGKKIIDRCNLTVFFVEGQEGLIDFLKQYKVTVVASLPCYSEKNVDQQRGTGTFEESIEALKMLNRAGYAQPDSDLVLDLVYNPLGATLPPSQEKLEKQYKEKLKEWFGIEFNSLYAITNMPIKRFMHYLVREDKLEDYMQVLLDSFNPAAALNVMCTNLVSISWDGKIYDCDFNQMLDIPIAWKATSLDDIQSFQDLSKRIAFDDHCYGCTAGAGSSCSGVLT